MRTKSERRVRHVTSMKTSRAINTDSSPGQGSRRASQRESLVNAKGGLFKKMSIDGQEFYIKLSTSKDTL